MGNVQMEAEQIRFKNASYRNVADGLTAAIESSGSVTLAGLIDTSITEPSGGQVLTYNGTSTKWENASIPEQSISGLSDTTITEPGNGQVLSYDGTSSKWVNAAAPSSGDVYAGTETEIGTWLGATLYRRVFHMTSVPIGTNSIETGIARNSITPRNCYGFMRIEKSDWDSRFVPFYDDASKNVQVQLVERSSEWRIFVKAATSYTEYVCDIVLEYTKNSAENNNR